MFNYGNSFPIPSQVVSKIHGISFAYSANVSNFALNLV